MIDLPIENQDFNEENCPIDIPKVELIIDDDNEMLSIEVNNKNNFYGNFTDFNRPESIIKLLKAIGKLYLTVKKGSLV